MKPLSKPEADPARYLAGRDVLLPRWLGKPAAPRFDSVVVCGNGIGGLCFAARLARSDAFAGRVVLAAPPIEESRRLIGGVTLRARAVDYWSAALGKPREKIVRAMFGDAGRRAETRTQHGALAVRRTDGTYSLGKVGRFMTSERYDNRPLAYGVRNSRATAALRGLMDGLAFREHPALPASLEEARALAPGTRPLVVNATPRPLDENRAPPPTEFVAASQIAFTSDARDRVGLLPEGSSFIALRRLGGALDAGVYYPLVDPLSPRATYYGIFYRVVRGAPNRDVELETRLDEVTGVGRTLGLEPHDMDETLGQAVVPCSPWTAPAVENPALLDLYRLYNSGAPIITGDGMARAGLAAVLASEAILAGEDPTAALRRGLAIWRRVNRGFHAGISRLPGLTSFAARYAPGAILGQVADVPDTWAGVA